MKKKLGGALARYLKFLYKRAEKHGNFNEQLPKIDEHMPYIFAMWHGQVLMMPLIKPDHIKVSAMVARHGDAEFIAQLLKPFDVDLIRGAGAGHRKTDRGGAYALRTSLKVLKAGHALGMTAEVPPGPSQQASIGIITLAKMSGRPIIPVAMASTRYLTLKNWSRFCFNLPSKKIGIMIGEPLYVPKSADANEMEALRQKLTAEMETLSEKAYNAAGADRTKSLPLARQNIPFNLRHKFHGGLFSAAGYIAPVIYRGRQKKGKEDPARQNERYGITDIKRPDGDLIWIHAASVGESRIALQLAQRIHQDNKTQLILITSGTRTSAHLIKQANKPHIIHQYLPFDSPKYVTRFLDHWRPNLGIFTESEIWPNLIYKSAKRDIPLFLINGRMSKRSHRSWRRHPKFAAPLFGAFEGIFVQSEEFARRFRDHGGKNILVSGNIKMDAPPPAFDKKHAETLKKQINKRPLFVAASTHDGEDEIIIKAHKIAARQHKKLLTILIPRHPERTPTIIELIKAHGLTYQARTDGGPLKAGTDIYLANTIGEMGLFYHLADFAFIGGSLIHHGGQNPIEAIKHKTAVLTGPHTFNFEDIYPALKKNKAALVVNNEQEMAAAIDDLLKDKKKRDLMIKGGLETLKPMTGALEMTYEQLKPYLPQKSKT